MTQQIGSSQTPPREEGRSATPQGVLAWGPRQDQRGVTLLETIIALGILGFVGVAFLLAVTTATRITNVSDEQIQAEALLRTQLDAVLAATYNTNPACYPSTCYPVTVTPPAQYTVAITVSPLDTPTCATDGNCNTLQEVRVSVSRPVGSGVSRAVLAVSAYKGQP